MRAPVKNGEHIARLALDLVKPRFALPLSSPYHGIKHWVRVWNNARMICDAHGIPDTVPCWFAFLHDSCRENEDSDPAHGQRAADWAQQLWEAGKIPITPGQLNQLTTALSRHSHGTTAVHWYGSTVAACWDADRLDLGRCGIYPTASRLCLPWSKGERVISDAWYRSRQ